MAKTDSANPAGKTTPPEAAHGIARPFRTEAENVYRMTQDLSEPSALLINERAPLSALAACAWARADKLRKLLDLLACEASADLSLLATVLDPIADEIAMLAEEIGRRAHIAERQEAGHA